MKVPQVRRFALSLPDTTEEPHFEYSSFRVRGKIFVTVPPDEEHIHVFVDDEERERALAIHSTFLEKLIWGGKVRGLRVRLSKASPGVVNNLIRAAWVRRHPNASLEPRGANAVRPDPEGPNPSLKRTPRRRR